jgi:cytochrome c55X
MTSGPGHRTASRAFLPAIEKAHSHLVQPSSWNAPEMMKQVLILGAAAGLLLGSAALAQTPAPAPALPPGSGEDLFSRNCGGCHGYDVAGGSGPSLFSDTLLSKRTDDMLLYTIRNGRPGTRMPPWKALLTDTQIGAIIAYARREGDRLHGRPAGR